MSEKIMKIPVKDLLLSLEVRSFLIYYHHR